MVLRSPDRRCTEPRRQAQHHRGRVYREHPIPAWRIGIRSVRSCIAKEGIGRPLHKAGRGLTNPTRSRMPYICVKGCWDGGRAWRSYPSIGRQREMPWRREKGWLDFVSLTGLSRRRDNLVVPIFVPGLHEFPCWQTTAGEPLWKSTSCSDSCRVIFHQVKFQSPVSCTELPLAQDLRWRKIVRQRKTMKSFRVHRPVRNALAHIYAALPPAS